MTDIAVTNNTQAEARVLGLRLSFFRNYVSARLDTGGASVVLTGPNGAGKTNLLEAVSLLSPGRGLRGASLEDYTHRGGTDAGTGPWAVSADIPDTTTGNPIKIGTGADPDKPGSTRRIVRVDGETQKSQAALAEYLSIVWLTPQMDRLFLEGASGRRRFFDRLVFTFDPAHAGRLTRYENALRQRSKLLREGKGDAAWLSSLESVLAETAVAVAAARNDLLTRLQNAAKKAVQDSEPFPRAVMALSGKVEEMLSISPALEVEEWLIEQFENSREEDAATGGAAIGVHRTDMKTRHAAKNMPADQCSTGEQKALLIAIVLAHARLIAAEKGRPPILLLDEIAAHLDDNRRQALFDLVNALGGQAWMTGTDDALFERFTGNVRRFRVADAAITER